MEKVINWSEEIFDRAPNSEKPIFDLVFIGAGPATVSYFSYLYKNNLQELILNRKILIIEKGSTFGSGCLGKYGINSNTSAEGFVRLICQGVDNEKDDNSALSPGKLKGQTPMKKELVPLNCFKVIYNHLATQTLLQIGSKVAPLVLIAEFLQLVGNYICAMASKAFGQNIFCGLTEVTRILEIKQPVEYEVTIVKNSIKKILRAKIVIMACGAEMKLNLELRSNLLKYIPEDKIILSDNFLQEDSFIRLYNFLKSRRTKKVVIIGGSHSGFSCAWLLLNGFSSKKTSIVSKCHQTLKSCDCCTPTNCLCLGEVQNLSWKPFEFEELDNLEIEILYRDLIKVYYSSEREAIKDGYTLYDASKAVNKNSNVYPFIGIRSDAKELYRSIVNKHERRVKLIKCETKESLHERIKDACCVIYAGGYTTTQIPIYTNNYKDKIELFNEDGGTCEVGKDLCVLNSEKRPLKQLYGIGQGFATFSIEVLRNGKKAKADSVNLYNTSTAKKLYKAVHEVLTKFPKSIIASLSNTPELEKKLIHSQFMNKADNRALTSKFQGMKLIESEKTCKQSEEIKVIPKSTSQPINFNKIADSQMSSSPAINNIFYSNFQAKRQNPTPDKLSALGNLSKSVTIGSIASQMQLLESSRGTTKTSSTISINKPLHHQLEAKNFKISGLSFYHSTKFEKPSQPQPQLQDIQPAQHKVEKIISTPQVMKSENFTKNLIKESLEKKRSFIQNSNYYHKPLHFDKLSPSFPQLNQNKLSLSNTPISSIKIEAKQKQHYESSKQQEENKALVFLQSKVNILSNEVKNMKATVSLSKKPLEAK